MHPVLPQVAALVGGSLRTAGVAVWDWQKREQLYFLELGEQVMSLQYSPGGAYLVLTRADFDSLALLDPRTGRSLFYMRKGFGIVPFAVVSRNENNIMTYQPSGLITYWDIRSGDTLRQVSTLADLSLFAVSPNSRFLAAAHQERLVVVDLLSGDRIDERHAPGLTALAFSPQGSEITGILRTAEGVQLRQWYFGGRFLLELTPPWGVRPLADPLALHYGEGRLYVGGRDGTIAALRADGSVQTLARNALFRYSDAAVLDRRVALAGAERIVLLESSFLTDTVATNRDGSPASPWTLSVRSLANPLVSASPVLNSWESVVGDQGGRTGSGTGLEFLDPNTLLVWSRGEDPPRLGILDVSSGAFQGLPVQLGAPLKQVNRFGGGIVLVDESGECVILNPFNFEPRFRYRSPGTNKLVFAVGDTLVAGKTSLSTFGSPLLQINELTGETVTIPDTGLLVYDLAFEPRDGNLYSVSVTGRGGSSRTSLKMHSGFGFERSRVLHEYPGEDVAAGLAVDRSGRVYSSLGYERVVVWDGERLQSLDDARHVHRALYAAADKLVAANRDGSLTFWDTRTRRVLASLYVFEDSTWGAVLANGRSYFPQDRQPRRP